MPARADEHIRAQCFHPSGWFVEFPKEDLETSIPVRFEKIVRAYPSRVAVKMGDWALKYDELNRIANRIARIIIKEHGPDKKPIGLLFENVVDGIAASLAALKAGKCSIALDPAWPQTKLAHVLADSNAIAIVTNDRQFELAATLSSNQRPALNLSVLDDSFSSENVFIPILPGDKSAITYTSGSTGDPKGVVETHRTQLHSVMAMSNQFHICPDDKLGLVHSIYFSAGRFQAFRALLNGASLVPFDIKTNGIDRMANWITEERITILWLPVAVFRQLLECCSNKETFGSVRLINVSGAPITQEDFELYKKNSPADTYFAFHMGSTEAYVVCCGIVDHTFSFPQEGTLAGYPIPDKEVHIVDDYGQDVPPGEVGEIVVKSRYLAAGYWGQPELTKAHFLLDPAGGDETVYLTGDLGKKLPDGFVIHMGRKDSMVKIKGYRIEPGEIERALRSHPEINDVAVVPWERADGEKYLAAYVVPNGGFQLTVDRLRSILQEKLPDHMIPSAFKVLETLPLLANGKVDRKALPAPDRSRPELDTIFVSPRSPTERKLAEIWGDILSLDRIGIYDDFFDLGGHSLAVSRVVSRVIEHFQLKIPLQSLFTCPTVAEMARSITTHQGKRLNNEELQNILAELESLSDEEAARLAIVGHQRDSDN